MIETAAPADTDADVWRPHVTVACVVVDGDRYLMVEEEVKGRLAYNQPAGHLDDGESLLEAAVRETLEETGWTVALEHLIGIHQWRSTEHGDAVIRFSFAAKALSHDAARPLDTGIQRALWLTRSEIAALGDRLRSPLVLMSIDALLAGQRLALNTLGYVPDRGRLDQGAHPAAESTA
ncbi:NUDIX hydrolase [Rhodanobacter sp. ANJX3]|uniref:NUDIX hydrolase n=1 Tax=Rhodanobacter sp. ANJX3 TaxID=2723083 RepID=UPI0021044708|nr:NUDIX hydrolase [Rhodanobacter sp. ANJX3]